MSYIYERVSPSDMARRAQVFERYEQLGGYGGINALHDWLTDLAEGTGAPIELDVIALCCEWAHYDNLRDAADEYDDAPEDNDELLDWFQDRTTVLALDNGTFLIQEF